MIFEKDYTMQIRDTGKDRVITNKGLLGVMEDVASLHSAAVGFGLYDIPKTNLTWLLLDWKLQVKARPKYGDKIHVKTWSRYIYKYYAYRDFEVYNEKSELVAIATSKWILIDAKKGKVTKVEDYVADSYESETDKSVFNITELDKIKTPTKIISSITYNVCRRDIDVYNHMHNLYYLDLAYEALPAEIYEGKELDNVRITYKREIKLGDKLRCMYAKEEGKHIIMIRQEDTNVINSIIELW